MFVYQRIFKREQHFIVGGINKFIIIRKEVQMSRETILYSTTMMRCVQRAELNYKSRLI